MKTAFFRVFQLFICSLSLLLTGCEDTPQPAWFGEPSRVALWEATGPNGQRAWIFGTVHALPNGVNWRRPALDAAIAQADRLVIEIGGAIDSAHVAEVMNRLGKTPGLPLPTDRIEPTKKAALAQAFHEAGLSEERFTSVESWSVALQLANAASRRKGASSADGVEQALRASAGKKPIVGFESVDEQFAMFDTLPTLQQSRLLEQTAAEIANEDGKDQDLLRFWHAGDDAAIARMVNSGILADPELRRVLLIDRNRRWISAIEAMTASGARPFVAVGAAHVVGPDGLPALLAQRGWKVRRIP